MSTSTPATAVLAGAGVAHTLHPYEHHDRAESYGAEAAGQLGVDPGRIYKTLVAEVTRSGLTRELVAAVVPVAGRLDLKALAAALGGKKATMADPAAAERATGYVVGGISPLGHRKRLVVVLDASIGSWPTVFVSAGRRGLQVELAPDDLTRLAAARVAPLTA